MLLQPLTGYNPATKLQDYSFLSDMSNTMGSAVASYPQRKLEEERYKIGTEAAKESLESQKMRNEWERTVGLGRQTEDVAQTGESGAHYYDAIQAIRSAYDDARKTIVKTVKDDAKRQALLGKLDASQDIVENLYNSEYPLSVDERRKWIEKANRAISQFLPMPEGDKERKFVYEVRKKYSGLGGLRGGQKDDPERLLKLIKDYDAKEADLKDKLNKTIKNLKMQLTTYPEGSELYIKTQEQIKKTKEDYQRQLDELRANKQGILGVFESKYPEYYRMFVKGQTAKKGEAANRRIINKLKEKRQSGTSTGIVTIDDLLSGKVKPTKGIKVRTQDGVFELKKFRDKNGNLYIGYIYNGKPKPIARIKQ
jgi:hypothetical protein